MARATIKQVAAAAETLEGITDRKIAGMNLLTKYRRIAFTYMTGRIGTGTIPMNAHR